MVGLIFCLTGLSFAVEMDNKIYQARYNVIVNAFSIKNNAFSSDFVPVRDDIAIVQEHQRNSHDQLLRKQAIFDYSYRPLLLKIGGWVSLIKALFLTADSTRAGYYSWLLGTPELTVSSKYSSPGAIVYQMQEPSVLQKEASNVLAGHALDWGLKAGIIGGLSYYFFNKAASYKNELQQLKHAIDLDKSLISALEQL